MRQRLRATNPVSRICKARVPRTPSAITTWNPTILTLAKHYATQSLHARVSTFISKEIPPKILLAVVPTLPALPMSNVLFMVPVSVLALQPSLVNSWSSSTSFAPAQMVTTKITSKPHPATNQIRFRLVCDRALHRPLPCRSVHLAHTQSLYQASTPVRHSPPVQVLLPV